MKSALICFLITSFGWTLHAAEKSATIVVGSKIFTESYILSEIAAQTLTSVPMSDVRIVRKLGMGSTGILFESLRTGAIDVYPEYTGTIAEAILKNPSLKTHKEIGEALAAKGFVMSPPLGFNNTYAIGVTRKFAEANQLKTLSDLKRVASSIRLAFSYEFMGRTDGYQGLVRRYGLDFDKRRVRRLDHSLAYQAIENDEVDAIDVYTTDSKIKKLELKVLEDDLHYFPVYEAVWLASRSFVEKYPMQWRRLEALSYQFDADKMILLNSQVEVERRSFDSVASGYLGISANEETLFDRISRRTLEHVWLVGWALAFSIVIGIPLGIVSARRLRVGRAILVVSAVVQTVPSLALLGFLIPLLGIGAKPALAALCLYSLLPVVLNTSVAIRTIDSRHIENARAFGLSRLQILIYITLPLASPTILSGVKTATIVSIGTATLAALIGAGGYGAPILSGLSLNDPSMILQGAVPAAVMALGAYILFELIARALTPAGLRR